MANNKIRIRLKSFDHKILDNSAEKIIGAAKKSGAQVVGPVPLPTEKEIYTEITSTSNRLPFWAQGRRRNGLLHICCNDPLHPYSVATARRPPPRRFAGAPRSRPPRSV